MCKIWSLIILAIGQLTLAFIDIQSKPSRNKPSTSHVTDIKDKLLAEENDAYGAAEFDLFQM